MRPVATPDVRRTAVDLVAGVVADEPVTVGARVPDDWTTSDQPHVLVAWDGTDDRMWPVATQVTVRISVWSSSPDVSERLLAHVRGLITAASGWAPGAGIVPAFDSTSSAFVATCTVIATMRNEPVEDDA